MPAEPAKKDDGKPAAKAVYNANVSEMIRSPKFYLLWMNFFIGSGAGLMVIGSVAGLAKKSMGPMAFVAVAIMAIGNASGRVIAGVLSDKIGRKATLTIMLGFQAVMMFAAIPVVGSGSATLWSFSRPSSVSTTAAISASSLPLPRITGASRIMASITALSSLHGAWADSSWAVFPKCLTPFPAGLTNLSFLPASFVPAAPY